jgi:S1 RNA binding domain protein
MQLEVGAILEGKVAGITKFGAFVALPGGKSGLVHISEIANTYVNDVHDHVQEGQTVKVKVLSIADDGKINLSIKKATEQPRPQQPRQSSYTPRRAPDAPTNSSFEDKLKQFMQDSDSRMSGNRLYADKRSGSRRRRD